LTLILAIALGFVTNAAAWTQNSTALTNKDVIDLKQAGMSEEIIILRIRSGPTQFASAAADLIALKSAGISDAIIAEMLQPGRSGETAPTGKPLDLSRAVLVLPFGSSVKHADSVGLPEATRTSVINVLKSSGMFSAVAVPEDVAGQKTLVEISAELVDFAAGSVAKRMLIGLGSGRANSSFDFVVKETASGKVLWKKTIKETASFWSNSASSSAQRMELPEKVAKKLAEELKKANLPVLR
jgi:hypothetical protein